MNHFFRQIKTNFRWSFTPTQEELSCINQRFQTLEIPNNFVKTAYAYSEENTPKNSPKQPAARLNPQTTVFCSQLGVDDPVELLLKSLNISDASFCTDDFDAAGEASFVGETEKRQSVISLSRLSLPQPVNDDYDTDEISKNEKTYESFTSRIENTFESFNSKNDNSFASLSPKNSSMNESLNSCKDMNTEMSNNDSGSGNLDIASLSVASNGSVKESPQPKKFIRRNADIYKEET